MLFVAATLVMVALLSFGSSSWATPTQGVRLYDDTVPDKSPDVDWKKRGESAVFTIGVTNPVTATDTWWNTVATDTVDSYLDITSVSTTQGSTAWVGQDVTFTIGTMAPGSSVTLEIDVEVGADAPNGYDVENIVCVKHVGYRTFCSDEDPEADIHMFYVYHHRYLPLGMKRYSTP